MRAVHRPLAEHDIHVWNIAFALSAASPHSERILSPDERVRAARFVHDINRRRFVASHIATRDILSRYLDCPPQSIRLTISPTGKPECHISEDVPPFRFSLSHSGDQAVLALSSAPIGIDLERINPRMHPMRLASRFYSPSECDALNQLHGSEQLRAFFAIWTRKEAYVKARGERIIPRLSTFSVSVPPSLPRLLLDQQNPGASHLWRLTDLQTELDYSGAIASTIDEAQVSYFAWNKPVI